MGSKAGSFHLGSMVEQTYVMQHHDSDEQEGRGFNHVFACNGGEVWSGDMHATLVPMFLTIIPAHRSLKMSP